MKQTLKQLVARFRAAAVDLAEPYLFDPEFVVDALNEAQYEAVIRARLLHECDAPGVCTIALTAGKSSYGLHESLYEITHLMRIEDGQPDTVLALKSVEWLTNHYPDWRTDHKYVLPFAVQEDSTIRLATPPKAAGQLRLEGYRLPLRVMCGDNDSPEINIAHHEKLVQWALFRAYSQPDSDGIDPQRASKAEAEFTAYFGPRPDADLRRQTREDTDHANVTYI